MLSNTLASTLRNFDSNLKNKSLIALVLICLMAGCSSYLPNDTLGPMSHTLVREIDKNPAADIGTLPTKGLDMPGIYVKKSDYYISDTVFYRASRNFLSNYNKALAELCKKKGGEFSPPFCQKNGSAEGVLFFAKVQDSRIRESLFSPENFNKEPQGVGELLIYEKTSENSPEFVKVIREKLGFKTLEEKMAAEDSRKKLQEEYRLSQYIRRYKDADAVSQSNIVLAYERYKSFLDYYGGYDPDGVAPRIRAFMSENKKAYEEKKADEERRRVARLRDEENRRIEQARLKIEAEAAKVKMVKTVGQRVCKSGNGTESVYSGYVVLGKPAYRYEQRLFETIGIVEGVSGERVMVRISSILSKNPISGDSKFLKELSGEEYEQVNQALWSSAYQWRPC